MCVNVKYIPTRSRFISLQYGDRYLIPCKCGKCLECQNQLHQEWYYRIYHEWLYLLKDNPNSYIFFDTLTYSDSYLPHLSEFFDIAIPKNLDYTVFSYEDVRLWKSRLRRQLKYHYNVDNIRIFLCAEYGTAETYLDDRGNIRLATHRPHYHVLFFVPDGKALPVDDLRLYVDSTWFFGRTDQVRKYGKKSNYFTQLGNSSELAVSNYVAKYVQKVSKFQRQIDWRIDKILKYFYSQQFIRCEVTKSHDVFDIDVGSSRLKALQARKVDEVKFIFDDEAYISWSKSYEAKQLKAKVVRLVNQFHRQSLGFGAQVLRDLDISELMDTGYLLMPDKEKIIRKIPLPKYYERKLFQEVVEYDGVKYWQDTELGKLWKQKKQSRLLVHLTDKYGSLFTQYNYHPDVTPAELARYVVYFKGRIDSAIIKDTTLEERLKMPNLLYNYVTPVDKSLFHGTFLSRDYVGNSQCYYSDKLDNAIPVNVFIANHVINEKKHNFTGYDAILDKLNSLQLQTNRQRQKAYDLKQEIKNREHMSQMAADRQLTITGLSDCV